MTIKIIGHASGSLAEVETNTLALRIVGRPQRSMLFSGAYSFANSGGGNASGIGLFNPGPTYAYVKKCIFGHTRGVAGTAANVNTTLNLMRGTGVAIAASATPGAIVRYRSSFPLPNAYRVSTVTGGTQDGQTLATLTYAVPATGGTLGLQNFNILDMTTDRQPLVLEPEFGCWVVPGGASADRISVTYYWEEFFPSPGA
jgi:hypothetical protein